MTPLPRTFAALEPNVLIARCVECKVLCYAHELCKNPLEVAVCPNKGFDVHCSNTQVASLAQPVL